MGNTKTNDLGKKKIGEGVYPVPESGRHPRRKENPG